MSYLSITNDKLLSPDEWKSIFGTTMHEKMLVNRLVVRNCIDLATVLNWLKLNCHSFYYHTSSLATERDEFRVYILNDADVLHFMMKWDGHEEEEPEDLSPPPMPPIKPQMPIHVPNTRPKKSYEWNSYTEGERTVNKN